MMREEPEFHVTIRVRNNRLLSRRQDFGASQKLMAEVIGISFIRYAELEQCKRLPVTKGEWTEDAIAIAEYWDVDPEVLFPDGILSLATNKVERALDVPAMALLSQPTTALQLDSARRINEVMVALTPREQTIIESRFGILDGHEESLDDIAATEGVSRERIRQIEAKALRKLRYSSLSGYLQGDHDKRGVIENARLRALQKEREEDACRKRVVANREAQVVEWGKEMERAKEVLAELLKTDKKEFNFKEMVNLLGIHASTLRKIMDLEKILPEKLHRNNKRTHPLPFVVVGKENDDLIRPNGYRWYETGKDTLVRGWENYIRFRRHATAQWLKRRIKARLIIGEHSRPEWMNE
jgi:RNA polymerase sigma factor (sigma-70 family)